MADRVKIKVSRRHVIFLLLVLLPFWFIGAYGYFNSSAAFHLIAGADAADEAMRQWVGDSDGLLMTFVISVVIAALWAPYIGKFGSLLKYYQEMLSYIAPPIVAAFLLGIFGKRVNGNGAFAGLITGLLTAIVLLFFKTQIFGNMHFLLVVPFLLFISMAVIYGASLLSPKPGPEKLNNTVFSVENLKEEWRGLSVANWYKNYLFWAIALLVSSAIIWIIFR